MISKSPSRRFVLLVSALGVALPLVLIAAANLAADPYAMFDLVHADWNECKPAGFDRLRLVKAYAIRRQKPDYLILGSSRALIGISPEHPAWPSPAVYNLALPDASMDEMDVYLEHAIAVHPVKTAVLGLDYFVFAGDHAESPDFDPTILAQNDWRLGWLQRDITAALSAAVLQDSLATVEFNRAAGSICPVFDNGWRNPVHAARADEARGNPRMRIFMTAAMFANRRYPRETDPIESFENLESKNAFEAYATIIKRCHDNAVDLRLYISPVHATLYETAAALGLFEATEEWKRRLAAINESAAAAAGRPPFPLVDFSGYNQFTAEAIPAGDSPAEMMYYHECSHFTPALGGVVLDRMLLGKTVPGFGRELTSASIDSALEEVRAERETWRSLNPGLAGEIAELAVSSRDAGQTGSVNDGGEF